LVDREALYNAFEGIKNRLNDLDKRVSILEGDKGLVDSELGLIRHMVENELSNVILSEKNANRNGRPKLSEETIQEIYRLRRLGRSQRWIAEYLGIGKSTVAKYDLLLKNSDIIDNNQLIQDKTNCFD
jgi:hypothetical protein